MGGLDIDFPRAGPDIAHGCAINVSVSARVNLVVPAGLYVTRTRVVLSGQGRPAQISAAGSIDTREHPSFKAVSIRASSMEIEVRSARPGPGLRRGLTLAIGRWQAPGPPALAPAWSPKDSPAASAAADESYRAEHVVCRAEHVLCRAEHVLW